ncbi:MAG TPA: lipoate--protein ligase family protein, partial [Spirochaetia bacterium]|nr:lipoate--protein ligase family protein [Spirochaetia bacterium]
FSLLKVPSEKLKGKLIQDIKDRVRGLDQLLGRRVGLDEAADAFASGFAAALGVELSPAEPSPDELAEAERHAEERYANEAWTAKR